MGRKRGAVERRSLFEWINAGSLRRMAGSRIFRAGCKLVLVLMAAACVSAGFASIEGYVHGQPRYRQVRPAVKFVGQPEWLRANRQILESLENSVRDAAGGVMLDRRQAARVGAALCRPEVGWVKSIRRVEVRPDGLIAVDCEFRQPAAMVQHAGACYLLDDEGVRLPGRYNLNDCLKSRYLLLENVEHAPPQVGQVWPGTDVSAGLDLSRRVNDSSFREQVGRIDLRNHGGRAAPHQAHIELVTRLDCGGASSRILWGRAPGCEGGREITARQKFILLENAYRQAGRIDYGRPYVDIRTWSDRVALPAVMQSERYARALNG